MRIESSRRLIDTVAWVLIDNGRILCARPCGKHEFYIPGGKREGQESDLQTLLREIDEELTVALIPESARHVGTYEAELPGDTTVSVRMACYTADYIGTLTPSSEIAEIAWFGYAERDEVPPVDQALFDDLVARGLLPEDSVGDRSVGQ
ncbi:NUDIX hydrolase [Nocardia spumae]|uniref:NUDIX hydrolase n=1 Tax=Nocardia spumae TaxID=2887190 RepID=UPI001D13D9FA|nr:NUDIX domain-containing protein [Nocardia spumae]